MYRLNYIISQNLRAYLKFEHILDTFSLLHVCYIVFCIVTTGIAVQFKLIQ